jgi:phosphoglycolate phosphatase
MPASSVPAGRPRAVLFDWDNTLVDSWSTIHEALVQTLTAMGHAPWTLAESKARVRLSLRDSFPAQFGARWEEARRIYMDAFQAIHLQRLTALSGVVELLDHLAAAGYYLAVVSNKTGPVLRREAGHLGWTRYFARLVGATDAAADKPDPAPIHLALAGSGIAAGPEVWYVGDTAVDIECALNAGCVPVLLGPAKPEDAEFSRHPPTVSFDDCSALFLHVRTL